MNLFWVFVRWCFNVTLFLAGVFGLAAGGSPNFITLASLLAVMGVGVGGTLKPSYPKYNIDGVRIGNLPVDSAVFLGLFFLLSWFKTKKKSSTENLLCKKRFSTRFASVPFNFYVYILVFGTIGC